MNSKIQILQGDNLTILPTLPSAFARLIYIDPPFNTGNVQKRDRLKTTASPEGTRQGFGGKTYEVEHLESPSYKDTFDNYEEFLISRIKAALHCLTPDGSLMVHLDYREVHYIKVVLDALLGRDHFMNEIIWSYDFGGRSKTRWSPKHDTILWYVLDPKNYVFNYDEIERIPYMAPGLCGAEKAERGKVPTDCLWQTIVPTNGKEKTGFPTQKPMGLLRRFITAHTHEGDCVLDFFCGSGTTGAAALENKRTCVLIDSSPEAIEITKTRLSAY